MKKILYRLLFIFLTIHSLNSQNEASNWYFGNNAGISFNPNGTVTSVDGGQIVTYEGCASISDQNGDLLFYTDGTTVYNRNHNIMSNGFGLLGDPSSSQSAIVVPKPGDASIYYIFTVGSSLNPNGLKYSVVDMDQSGGLGAITLKNVNLLNNCSEKISAVLKDCESQEIWVITLANNTGGNGEWNMFYSYRVTTSGVISVPVTSLIPLGIFDARGYLKLSPDGQKLACANVENGLYLFDFDSQTGLVSSPIYLPIGGSVNKPYGLEFSPSSDILYVTASNNYFAQDGSQENPANHRSVLLQYDLNAVNISASQTTIDDRNLYRGGLQLGPNGKIYRALSATYEQGLPFLGVINNPNILGVGCGYQHNAVSLGNNTSTQGLPPFIQSFFNERIDIIGGETFSTYLPLCEGQSYTLTSEDIPGAIYTWTMDGVTLPETGYQLNITQSGFYHVLIELPTGECDFIEGEADVEYFINPTASNANLVQCDEDGVYDGLSIFNLEEAVSDLTNGDPNLNVRFFPTLTDLQNNTNPVVSNLFSNTSNPQTIYAQVVTAGAGCSDDAQLTLQVVNSQLNDYAATPVCNELGSEDGISDFDLDAIRNEMLLTVPAGTDITFYLNENDALIEQNELTGLFTNSIPYLQIIYARAENNNGCFGISEVILTVLELPQLEEDSLVYYCLNYYPETTTLSSGNLDSNINDYTYLWSNGEITESIEVNQPGEYTITVTNTGGCSKSRSITVEASNIATIESVQVVDGSSSFNNLVTVNASGEGIYQYAIYNQYGPLVNYQENNLLQNVPPGIHIIRVRDVKNNCGEVEQLVSVIGFPKFFTPNNDGYQDTWQVYGVSEQFQPNSKILIFDRYGKLVKQVSPLGNGWDGTMNGRPLPNDDYWFAVTLQDGRVFKSHFALKR